MQDISCPHCGKAFKINETGYADILKQVRDKDFEQQIHNRLELAEKDKLNAVELAKTQVINERQSSDAEKDAKIQELIGKLGSLETESKLAVSEAKSALEKERDQLANELAQAR